MKTKTTSHPVRLSRAIFTSLLAIAAACLSVGTVGTTHAQNDLFASINGNAFAGGGSIFRYTPPYTPATRSIFFSPLYQPRGLVFDSSGNLFVAINTPTAFPDPSSEQTTILKITPDGMMSSLFATTPSLFIAGIATDGAGNIFVNASNDNNPNLFPSTLYKITPDGTVSPFGLQSDCIQSDNSQCSVPGQSISLAFDGAGNLFAADLVDLIIYKFTPAGVRSIFVCSDATVCGSAAFPFTSTQAPVGLAFDGSGNLFVSTAGNYGNPGGDAILKFTPDGTGSTIYTELSNPKGLAFDTVGNLFVAEIPPRGPNCHTATPCTGDILKFTPGGTRTVVDSGLGQAIGNGGPEFLAFSPAPVTPATPEGSNVIVNSGTVGSAVIALTFSQVTVGGTTTVTPIDPNSAGTPPPGLELTGSNLAFDITTTATYTPPIIIAFQMQPSVDTTAFSQLRVLHNENGILVDRTVLSGPFAPNPTTQTIYASVSSLSPFVIAKLATPTNMNQCKNGGWQTHVRANGTRFKNQGDCNQYVNTGK